MSGVSLRAGGSRSPMPGTGQGVSGWGILAQAAQELRVQPGDGEVRLLAAKALESLGLRRLAWETASQIEGGSLRLERDRLLGAHRDARAIERDVMVQQARVNAAMLDVAWQERAIEAWVAEGTLYHRASDGNVVRQNAEGSGLAGCEWVCDLRREASEFAAAHLSQASRVATGPLLIEGLSPPWVAMAVADATPRLRDGYMPPLIVVQRSESELAEGLSFCDLSALLSRAIVIAGEDAVERVREVVRRRFGFDAIGAVIPIGVLRDRCEPGLSDVMRDLGIEQRRLADELRARVIERDRERDASYWRARFAEARPRRVLVATTRYSTYVQHASRDLAAGFEALGWESRLMIEADDGSRFSPIAYMREQLEFDPDLIVLINWPRATRAEAFCSNAPFVCWIQDSMPHLFDAKVGAAHGERDFVMGHVYPSLLTHFKYPAGRALSTPVVACGRKFYVSAAPDLKEYACEIAYVSHHSETPEALHVRLRSNASDPQVVRVLDAMRDLIVERYGDICGEDRSRMVKDIPCEAWLRVRGSVPEPRVAQQLREQYLVPMIERVLRHEMLNWAVRIAQRRGWRLRIYGREWELHAKFGTYAAGVLEHGEQLRAAYQGASVQLHASMTSLVHQRVMECALSGGLPLCRVIGSSFGQSRQRAIARVARVSKPDCVRAADGFLGFDVEKHEPLRLLREVCVGTGFGVEQTLWVHPQTLENMKRFGVAFEVATPEDLLGSLEDVTFSDEAGLERCVERAISDPAWRRSRGEQIAERVRVSFTHEATARRVIEMVESTVARGGSEALY
ncbi:MAG: hypothetical protein KF757_04075 [Phycisphaeraceae bacterium]|nr:hypothetical protein [Phycisphaeraceae bacterium]MCW5763179.1 hypothetical protein [Phycisphaeraceae bacterium]